MTEATPRERAHTVFHTEYLDRATLAARGLTPRACARLVRAGRLVRVRRGRLLPPDTHPELLRAGRLGGRLDCVSLLAAVGVFVRERGTLHVQFDKGASRLPARDRAVIAHWRRSDAPQSSPAAHVIEALAQACRCQAPRDAIATLDSAWHHGIVDEAGVGAVFTLLPRAYRRLRGLLDRRAESGTESLVRLALRGWGCQVDVQVEIAGVGRVDLVVDGWLIIECDSRAHHDGWNAARRDRRRDLAAAALGFTTVRPIAEDILGDPERVFALLKATIAHGRRT